MTPATPRGLGADAASDVPARPRLELVLDGALASRLTLLVADAGFGKTNLLSSWSRGLNAVTYPLTSADANLTTLWRGLAGALRTHLGGLPGLPASVTGAGSGPGSSGRETVRAQAMAEALGQALEQRLTRDLLLVLDDAHLAGDGPPAGLLAGLVRHAPPRLHLVLAARTLPPVATSRLRAQAQVLEVSGADLAFTTEEVAALLAEVWPADAVDATTAELAASIRSATGGWPIAVRLAVEALRSVPPDQRAGRVERLTGSQQQLADLLEEIYRQEAPQARQMLAAAALLERFTAGLCEALGVPGAGDMIAGLVRRGLFVEPYPAADASGDCYRIHPLARSFLARAAPIPDADRVRVHRTAAQWFAGHGQPAAALRSLSCIGDHDGVARLLAEAGDGLVNSGQADPVLDAVASLPHHHRGPDVALLAGNAHLVRGQWSEALASYQHAAGSQHPQPAELAWRIGLIHYLRGEHEQALAAYRRGATDGTPSRDIALLLAWAASAHWIRGERAACEDLAERALRAAGAVDDPAALAAAHTVQSMLAAFDGDRRANAAHYAKALQHAERAGDVLQLIRIHSNRASHHLEEGTYDQAMAELDVAIGLADLTSYGAFGALALSNRAEIRARLGQLEEAHRDVAAAAAILEELGSALAAHPLRLLGRLHHLRGERGAAIRTYRRALARAERSGDVQAVVPVLAGLARVLAEQGDPRAREVVRRALSYGEGLARVEVELAAAWVARANGETGSALAHVRAARAAAGARRDRGGTAEALEIESVLTDDRAQARELAMAAEAVYAELGDPIGRAAAELAYADRLSHPAARALAATVRRRMAEIGCRLLVERAEAVIARHPAQPPAPVRIETLGGFRLVRDGVAAPMSAWRSRKSREVLKVLLARRGRPVTREALMEMLWPGEPPAALANRLHVAVSTLRSVLDPEHRFDSQRFVAGDDAALRVRLEHLEVDVESFLVDAATGLSLLRAGQPAEALPHLIRAEARYAGAFLEEDLYADWAVPLREQARAAYLSVAARLAQHAEASGDLDGAVRFLLRILEHDPYDERAHLHLVTAFTATGRHGDARRHYRHYCVRMEELGVEAAPFPT